MHRKDYEYLSNEIKNTMGTSMDIDISSVNYLVSDDKVDKQVFIEEYEEVYTQLVEMEEIQNEKN